MTLPRALFRLLIALLFAAATHAASIPPKIICFGDSITKRGYPAELAKLLGVEVLNAGVGGNTTTGALRRLQTDVLDKNPTLVVVFFGTNDSRLDAPKVHVPVDRYVANLRQIITRCSALPARVVLCTLPPINPAPYFQRHAPAPFDAAGGLAKILETSRTAVLALGRELDLPVVDLHALLAQEPTWLSPDGVHPTDAGNTLIAKFVAEKVAPLVSNHPSTTSPASRPFP
jgi:lysophospholipase L1-like esterase